ncbi:tripartite motif-containing protein 51-like [Carlito syrichta]|uniref:Tripartite motif-containing protein 51-like n=1 Tax=Carlito syrichta TaxID=1868482 RepID=A0A1U7U499_CARSF|nr:tripartite motif-containing protein 51-like [Carlito syrichta]
MNSRLLQVFQKELTCPICMKYFLDPVTIDCGHSFCRSCLYLSWQDSPVHAHCFECMSATQQRNFKTDIRMKKMASLARRDSLWQFLSSEEQMCGTHKETKKMFCEVDKSLLCSLCSKSQEHQAHRHCPIEGAAEEQREKLLKKMHFLWEKACENHRNLNIEAIKMRSWEGYVNLRKEAIRAEYQKMPVFLHEEEQLHLERLQREGQDIFQQLHESGASMSHKSWILRGVYKELKETCHKLDVELLQVYGDISRRSESVLLDMPQPVNPELSAGSITGLMDRLSCFQVNITLDREGANSHIVLHGELRNMSVGCNPEDAACVTPRSGCFLAWGAQTFTSGKFYWEVDVGNFWNWAFGVCNDYWMKDRRNDNIDEKEGLFLLGCVKEDGHCLLFTTSPLIFQYVPRPTGRIGVFLDYEGRTVSFVDVAQSSLIYSIPSCTFSPQLRPIFCCSHF